MASTYSTRLRLELMGSGDQSGTWGTTTNTNLGTLIEAAIAGRAAVSMTDADYTLTTANGTADEARNMILNISGALTATRNVICPAVSKLYVVRNATTGGQSIVIKTSAGTGVTIRNGLTSLVFCDGTNFVEGVNNKVDKAGDTMTGSLTAPNFDSDGGAYVAKNAASGYVFFGTLGSTPYGVNFDRFQIGLDVGAQKCYIGTQNGGTGLFRETHIVAGGVSRIQVTAGGFILLNTSNVTVAVIDNAGNLSVKGGVFPNAAI